MNNISKAILFFTKNHQDKKLCREVFYLLKDLNPLFDQEIINSEIATEWMELTEYFLFEPELYASNYPKPDLDIETITELKKFLSQHE